MTDKKIFVYQPLVPNKTVSTHENELVLGGEGEIFLFHNMKLIKFADRKGGIIRDLCVHNGKLYDCTSFEGIYETIPDREINRGYMVMALCSFDGELYNSETDGLHNTLGFVPPKPRDVDISIHNNVAHWSTTQFVVGTKDLISVLCPYNGELYDGRKHGIYKTFSNTLIFEREEYSTGLCAHNGKLYDGTSSGKIYETVHTKIIAERSCGMGLCSHNGKLYDYGDGVYETFTNKKILNETFSSMASVDKKIVEEILFKIDRA